MKLDFSNYEDTETCMGILGEIEKEEADKERRDALEYAIKAVEDEYWYSWTPISEGLPAVPEKRVWSNPVLVAIHTGLSTEYEVARYCPQCHEWSRPGVVAWANFRRFE